MTGRREQIFTPYPYGMCEADADLYDQDAEPNEMRHPECQAIALHRTDEALAWLLEEEGESP